MDSVATTIPVSYETLTVGRITVGAEGPRFAYDDGWLATRGAFPNRATESDDRR